MGNLYNIEYHCNIDVRFQGNCPTEIYVLFSAYCLKKILMQILGLCRHWQVKKNLKLTQNNFWERFISDVINVFRKVRYKSFDFTGLIQKYAKKAFVWLVKDQSIIFSMTTILKIFVVS